MSERDFAMALAMLAEAFGEKGLTPVRIEAYHRSLSDIPMPVLNHAVGLAIKGSRFFPRVAELRKWCEQARIELRGALKHEPCAVCEQSPGWAAVLIDGIPKVTRCQCWKAHQAKVEALGVGNQPLALPAAVDDDAA